MTSIAILDTSIESNNDGDEIIVRAVMNQFPHLADKPRLPTHRYLTTHEQDIAQNSDVLIVTGTNILTSRLWRDRQWKLRLSSIRKMGGKVVFLGAGWRQYQGNPTRLTRKMMQHIVNEKIPISARDNYTAEKLVREGFAAINTACPTMWGLKNDLPLLNAVDECVFTLTDYNPDIERDAAILEFLTRQYSSVHIWAQSDKDARNIARLNLANNVYRAGRGIPALDDLLRGRDYVGTRLHAGVRAAQAGSSALVVAVDNRALEISRDTGFPVVERSSGISSLKRAFDAASAERAVLSLPMAEIELWKRELSRALGTPEPAKPKSNEVTTQKSAEGQ